MSQFTSLFYRSTLPFSSLEYGICVMVATRVRTANLHKVWFMNREPQSVIISSGVLKRHKSRHKASVTAVAVTTFVGKIYTYLVKVSMITKIYLNSLEISIGPIGSITILCMGYNVDKTKRNALIALYPASIFWLCASDPLLFTCNRLRWSVRMINAMPPRRSSSLPRAQ